MSYFIIDGTPVFVSSTRYRSLLQDLGLSADLASTAERRANMVAETLSKRATESRDRFQAEWVQFDMRDSEAQENIWDLLYDYCHLRRSAHLVDTRDYVERLEHSLGGDSLRYPMGLTFDLQFYAMKPATFWQRVRGRLPYQTVTVLIDVRAITRAVGDLSDFQVHTAGSTLICGSTFQISTWPMLGAPS